MISDKVRLHHLERKALLYVRQSSAHQVLHNRESSALQFAMRDRLAALGWSEIEVIDDDLGRSAAGGVQCASFERMVAEVCLGKVGAVCARECPACGSRFNASCTCNARLFIPRRMSVWPTATHTRTPEGTGIIAPTAL
jgi:hypothetical protein